jgi:signal peptidase I
LAGKPTQVRKRKRPLWQELAVLIVAACILTLVIKAFVVQVFRIPSGSMEDTLQVGDRVLVNKFIYHFRGIARGDVVVFSGQNSWGPPDTPASSDPVVRLWDDALGAVGLNQNSTDYVKRVIGLPGDHVACCTDGHVTVNGVALSESSYLYPGDAPSTTPFSVVVPAGRLWVMGDHRSDSADSRYHLQGPGEGTIPENEVVGRAFFIMWPPSQLRDLPIPSTFQQTALKAAAGASGAVPVVPALAGVAGGVPLLLRRRRRSAAGSRRGRVTGS